jgi:hypothetical protein
LVIAARSYPGPQGSPGARLRRVLVSTRGWTGPESNPAPIRDGRRIPTVDVMHDLLNGLLIAAVVVFVIYRRFAARRVAADRPYVLPVILAVVGIGQGHVIDPQHQVLATVLLTGEIVAALGLGCGLGATMRVWRERDGSVWSRGTWATFGVFLAAIAVRGGAVAFGYAAGVKAGTGDILVSVAAWMLTQNLVLAWRARTLPVPVSVDA